MTVLDEAKEHMMDLAAKIMSGICANPCLSVHWKTHDAAVEYALNSAEKIIIGANKRIGEIKERAEKKTNRESTGFTDATGKQILEGDIFVYKKYLPFKDAFERRYVPDDIISNWATYENTVCLHPVFFDEDKRCWASDVYGDADPLSSYDADEIVVVTNIVDHPEFYNH